MSYVEKWQNDFDCCSSVNFLLFISVQIFLQCFGKDMSLAKVKCWNMQKMCNLQINFKSSPNNCLSYIFRKLLWDLGYLCSKLYLSIWDILTVNLDFYIAIRKAIIYTWTSCKSSRHWKTIFYLNLHGIWMQGINIPEKREIKFLSKGRLPCHKWDCLHPQGDLTLISM